MNRKRINKSNFNRDNNPIYSSVYGKGNVKVIKNTTSTKKYYYTHGDIGFDKEKSDYINHLMKRYNEYKKKEVGKESMNYNLFEVSLKKHFNISDKNKGILHLPIEQFEELYKYIQKRISSTKFAITLGRNHKNFSSYEEYIERQS